ncbi:MAG: pyruvate formate lyase family protein, partial [Clostridia bacterium]|nr:pyruvate formate lyase family protein [Clostridia bacterium]
MEFFTSNGRQRPIRLCEATRRFAADSLNRRYGLETVATPSVSLDDIADFEKLSPIECYDLAIERIASKAPIRICEGERISGAATLGEAIRHHVPASYQGATVYRSISHLTVDFETVLSYGLDHIRAQASDALKQHTGTEREPFSRSCLRCLDAFDLWHRRYLDELAKHPEYADNLRNLLKVPHRPAETFYEAVQSLWFTFAFLRLCGNWPGIGRLDVLLGRYLRRDLAKGILTLDEAREILAHFFIKGCEWINGVYIGSGDAQHYQNIVLGGIDENGYEVTCEVTYLVLDILEELGISDFPTTVRLNRHTDERLLRRVAEVMRYGGGILAVYNEDLVLDALRKDGYEDREAKRFANDGCWEVQIPGKTYFIYRPFDSLQILQQKTLKGYSEPLAFSDFQALYDQFKEDLKAQLEEIMQSLLQRFVPASHVNGHGRWR